jgi:hypothetical protein
MLRWRVLLLSLFALAMGHLEAVVVVYIRYALGDLHGTGQVPDPVMQAFPWGIEATREVATLVMLGTLAALVARTWRLRAAVLLGTFGIWDATYYAALKIMTGWPAALTTYDVYFLLPWPWGGPVWFPLLADACMLAVAAILVVRTQRPNPVVTGLRAVAPESRLEQQGGGRPLEDRG